LLLESRESPAFDGAPVVARKGRITVTSFRASFRPGDDIMITWRRDTAFDLWKGGSAVVVFIVMTQETDEGAVYVRCEVPNTGAFLVTGTLSRHFRTPGEGVLLIGVGPGYDRNVTVLQWETAAAR
jgi:hypothetical protein